MSDAFDGLTPPVPMAPTEVWLNKVKCRGEVSIVQAPTAENDFTTIIEFNDNGPLGSEWYEAKVMFTPKP